MIRSLAEKSKVVLLMSGGMDSSVLLYHLVQSRQAEVVALGFDYGQKHHRELKSMISLCTGLGVSHHLIDLSDLGMKLKSSLTLPTVEVPEGHYAADNMKSTVVPNRNMIMMSIAWGIAVANGCHAIATAVHAGDHFIYPDCRPAYLGFFEMAAQAGNEGMGEHEVGLYAPFMDWSKAEIAGRGFELQVPFELTWSCYKGGDKHCGKCGTCVERREAFQLAGVKDPTEYEA